MSPGRELFAFVLILALGLTAFFHETLIGGKVLSPADVLRVSASFRDETTAGYEPANRLLMDPVLQFQPWLEFNRRMVRSGRLPLWNSHAGCGVPHLANGQSAVFDPFHLLAYLGPTPRSYAWIAAVRLFAAGLGMFLLARSWGLGVGGRWFAGLVYSFCGFLMVWLLYPVTSVAIWMPWLFFATERVFRAPGPGTAGVLAIVTALVLFGGHIQTSAHVLLATGLYALWRTGFERGRVGIELRRVWLAGVAGIVLGVAMAAVQILPQAAYLAKSSVWGDRQRELPAWWSVVSPRWLDAICTVVPYAYGSQRFGHPNLARALGVHNLNESAGGFAGLTTVIWLAPLAFAVRRKVPRVGFLVGMVSIGAMGAFRLPPVDNFLRALPVLDVTDNRRLTLWVGFGLTLLGGIGIDHLGETARLARGWIAMMMVGAIAMGSVAFAVRAFEPAIRTRAYAHYGRVAVATEGADPTAYRERAERQVHRTLEFLPHTYGLAAAELGILAALSGFLRRVRRCPGWARPAIVAMTLFDLGVFGFGLNPAIRPESQSFEPPVIARLRGIAAGRPRHRPWRRTAAGRADAVRPIRSPELRLRRAGQEPGLVRPDLRALRPLAIEPQRDHLGVGDSRPRSVARRVRRRDRGRDPAPRRCIRSGREGRPGLDRLARRPAMGQGGLEGRSIRLVPRAGTGRLPAPCRLARRHHRARDLGPGLDGALDGKPLDVVPGPGPFLTLYSPKGEHQIILQYDPIEVRIGSIISACAAAAVILILTRIRVF